MHKIIYNNVIIDIVKNLRYVRYVPEIKKIVPTGIASAQAVCGSDNKTYYALMGAELPPEKQHWKRVTVFPIDEEEYNSLSKRLGNNQIIYANNRELSLVRQKKIDSLSSCCKDNITSGIRVLMDNGIVKTFKLTIEDQLNLVDLEKDIEQGSEFVMYHSTNEVCTMYSKNEILRVIDTARKHKKYHTTYFNLLKYCINNMNNIDEIESLEYGVDLLTLNIPDNMKSILEDKLYG